VAEYRAIFGGAGADVRLLGALQMKILSHIANGEMGVHFVPFLKSKRRFRYNAALAFVPNAPAKSQSIAVGQAAAAAVLPRSLIHRSIGLRSK